MIAYVTGVLGHGKSLYGARLLARALISGRVVATNMRLGHFEGREFLAEGWEHEILRHTLPYIMASQGEKAYMRREMWTRYHYEEDFGKLLNIMIHGFGEGRGVRLIDESHINVNNRNWKDELQTVATQRLSMSRKVGFNDYIISQHAKNTDVAIRRIASHEIRVVDWYQILRVPVFHAPLLPGHLFLAQHFPIEESATPGVHKVGRSTTRELYRLGWWRGIYDTHALYSFGEVLTDAETVWLPKAAPPADLHALPGGARPAEGLEALPADAGGAIAAVESGGSPLPVPGSESPPLAAL